MKIQYFHPLMTPVPWISLEQLLFLNFCARCQDDLNSWVEYANGVDK